MILRVLLAAVLLLWGAAAHAATGDRLVRTGFTATFAEEFTAAELDIYNATTNPSGRWKTNYYFGYQSGTQAQQWTSRNISGERQVYVDNAYCGRNPFAISGGRLILTAWRASAVAKASCGQGVNDYLSGLISTQTSFSQTRGYWEARFKIPKTSGTWPAFWLVPTANNTSNGGRLPEIDIFEHYGGVLHGVYMGTPFILDRTGKPITTLHTGTVTSEVTVNNSAAPPKIDLNTWHTFGLLWKTSELIFYIDDLEIWRTTATVSDPHYLIINMAISGTQAGDPDTGAYPTTLQVDWVRAWSTP